MENRHRKTFVEVWAQAKSEHWEELPDQCPKCNNGAVEYHQEDEYGNREEDHWFCKCSWCDASWWVPIQPQEMPDDI